MEEKKKKSIIDWLSLSIAAIGLILAYLSYNQSQITKDEQQLMTRKIEIIQSQPQLYIEYNRADNLEDKGLLLQNLGNGTAEIIDFTIHRNRKQYEDTISNGYKSWFKNSSELIFENQLWYESLIQLVPGTLISNTERGDIKFIYTEGYKITPDKTKGDTKLVFTGTNDSKYIQDLIIEIKYKSISPFDSSTYYLTYSESFTQNNMRGEILDKKSIAYEEGY